MGPYYYYFVFASFRLSAFNCKLGSLKNSMWKVQPSKKLVMKKEAPEEKPVVKKQNPSSSSASPWDLLEEASDDEEDGALLNRVMKMMPAEQCDEGGEEGYEEGEEDQEGEEGYEDGYEEGEEANEWGDEGGEEGQEEDELGYEEHEEAGYEEGEEEEAELGNEEHEEAEEGGEEEGEIVDGFPVTSVEQVRQIYMEAHLRGLRVPKEHTPCRYFFQARCKDRKCPYSHDERYKHVPLNTWKPSMCKFFLAGECTSGEECKWSHDEATRSKKNAAEEATRFATRSRNYEQQFARRRTKSISLRRTSRKTGRQKGGMGSSMRRQRRREIQKMEEDHNRLWKKSRN